MGLEAQPLSRGAGAVAQARTLRAEVIGPLPGLLRRKFLYLMEGLTS